MTAPRVVLEFRHPDDSKVHYKITEESRADGNVVRWWSSVEGFGWREIALTPAVYALLYYLARQPSAEPVPCSHDWYNGVCRHCLIPADEWRRNTPAPSESEREKIFAACSRAEFEQRTVTIPALRRQVAELEAENRELRKRMAEPSAESSADFPSLLEPCPTAKKESD